MPQEVHIIYAVQFYIQYKLDFGVNGPVWTQENLARLLPLLSALLQPETNHQPCYLTDRVIPRFSARVFQPFLRVLLEP